MKKKSKILLKLRNLSRCFVTSKFVIEISTLIWLRSTEWPFDWEGSGLSVYYILLFHGITGRDICGDMPID